MTDHRPVPLAELLAKLSPAEREDVERRAAEMMAASDRYAAREAARRTRGEACEPRPSRKTTAA